MHHLQTPTPILFFDTQSFNSKRLILLFQLVSVFSKIRTSCSTKKGQLSPKFVADFFKKMQFCINRLPQQHILDKSAHFWSPLRGKTEHLLGKTCLIVAHQLYKHCMETLSGAQSQQCSSTCHRQADYALQISFSS